MLAGGQTCEAGLQVLAHGQQRKDLAALGHVGDALPGPLVGLERRQVLAVQHDAPARTG